MPYQTTWTYSAPERQTPGASGMPDGSLQLRGDTIVPRIRTVQWISDADVRQQMRMGMGLPPIAPRPPLPVGTPVTAYEAGFSVVGTIAPPSPYHDYVVVAASEVRFGGRLVSFVDAPLDGLGYRRHDHMCLRYEDGPVHVLLALEAVSVRAIESSPEVRP